MIANSFGVARHVTATATLNPQQGRLLGFYVNSTTNGTVVLRDGGASGTALTGTITPAVGWHPLPITYSQDLHVTIANTLAVTFVVS